jgi:hypothetical protein
MFGLRVLGPAFAALVFTATGLAAAGFAAPSDDPVEQPALIMPGVASAPLLMAQKNPSAPKTAPAANVTVPYASGEALLLEASSAGSDTAVPFGGTVEWSIGTDYDGREALVAMAVIGGRNLEMRLVIGLNHDDSVPATHLFEISFDLDSRFPGESIASVPGILLKDERLVQGTPLVGASARVVGNEYLFALSAAAIDSKANRELLLERRWIDIAVVYGTGRRAIVTLEKTDAAMAMFREVFAAWNEP